MGWTWVALLAAGIARFLMLLVGYVSGGGGSFPHPLSPEEEADCLERMARGDKGARAKLIEHNLRLVAHLAKKFEASGEESDDLISVGTIGLIKGIETYDASKGTKLATYAARCIENESSMTSPPHGPAPARGPAPSKSNAGSNRQLPSPSPSPSFPPSSPPVPSAWLEPPASPCPWAVPLASKPGSSLPGMQMTWPTWRL
ncbi:MAG: sigma factor [Bacillota bacterium]|nr:sigma factor [Bacillota bacterium]